jgi:crossover junction endodeoxyribonuclease RuvC
MVIFAIDPGVENIGIAIKDIDDRIVLGTIVGSENIVGIEKVSLMIKKVMEFISSFEPDYIVIEDYGFSGKFFNVKVAEIVGILKYVIYKEKISCNVGFVAPNTIKLHIAGKGNATKAEVKSAVKKIFGNICKNSHEADALALLYLYNKFLNRELDMLTTRKLEGRWYKNACKL